MHEPPCDLSYVVIGLNEGAKLTEAIGSVVAADAGGRQTEVIYVDGGSRDGSLARATAAGAARTLGGDLPRRAAENRNLGWRAARGLYVQFVDGDMTLDAAWPAAACAVLDARPEVAAVWGRIEEIRQTPWYRAFALDWQFPEGPSRYCGGAALFRRAALESAGGFPEDVAYGEEPLLCWRLRHGAPPQLIWHLHRAMVYHDLDFKGPRDWWRRNVRCGATFAEIAARCRRGPERLWWREVASNLLWGTVLAAAAGALALGGGALRLALFITLLVLLARKTIQFARRGAGVGPALRYALHTYLSKFAIALGIVGWLAVHAGRLPPAERAPSPAADPSGAATPPPPAR